VPSNFHFSGPLRKHFEKKHFLHVDEQRSWLPLKENQTSDELLTQMSQLRWWLSVYRLFAYCSLFGCLCKSDNYECNTSLEVTYWTTLINTILHLEFINYNVRICVYVGCQITTIDGMHLHYWILILIYHCKFKKTTFNKANQQEASMFCVWYDKYNTWCDLA
jgi:hypothetical protein